MIRAWGQSTTGGDTEGQCMGAEHSATGGGTGTGAACLAVPFPAQHHTTLGPADQDIPRKHALARCGAIEGTHAPKLEIRRASCRACQPPSLRSVSSLRDGDVIF